MHRCMCVILPVAVKSTARSAQQSSGTRFSKHSCCPQHTTGILLFTGKDENASNSTEDKD